MKPRGIAVLLLLLAAVALERFSYYGQRSFLSIELHGAGVDVSSRAMIMTGFQGLVMVAFLFGGGVAFGVGPRVAAAGGAAIAMLGHAALAIGAPLVLGGGLVAFGAGFLRPCIFAAAAQVLAWDEPGQGTPGPHRFAAMTAFGVASYGAISLGAFLSSPVMGAVQAMIGFGAAHAAGAGVMLLATVALVVTIALRTDDDATPERPVQGPYREGVQPLRAPPPPSGPVFAGLGILLAAEVVFMLASTAADPPYEFYSKPGTLWMLSINPIAIVLSSVALVVVLVVAAMQRSTLSPLQLYGGGMVVFALGLLPVAAISASTWFFALGQLITGLGEPAMYAVPLAYAAIAVRGRAAALVVAGWMLAAQLATMVGNVVGAMPELRTPTLLVCALLGVGGGAALLALGRKMHVAFFDPPPPPPPVPWGG